MYQILEKFEAEFTGIILQAGLSLDPPGELTALLQTQWPNLNFLSPSFAAVDNTLHREYVQQI